MFKQICIFVMCITILATVIGCKFQGTPIPSEWKTLQKDKEWVENFNRFLSMSYIEEEDMASFYAMTSANFEPSLYATYHALEIYKAMKLSVPEREEIVSYFKSLRQSDGSYLDVVNDHSKMFMTDGVRRATTILHDLGATFENVDSTVAYLLSCILEDGTFLDNPNKQINPVQDTIQNRLGMGTYYVIESLYMLGQIDKVPQQTKDAILDQVTASLKSVDQGGGADSDVGLVRAIYCLARIDPSLVPADVKVYITDLFNKLSDKDFLNSMYVNLILDTGELLGVVLLENKDLVLSGGNNLKDYVASKQNSEGGFGPPGNIDPYLTAEYVKLLSRLGLEYPQINIFLNAIDVRWTGEGWSQFFSSIVQSSRPQEVRYALEIAKVSGFTGYSGQKIRNYLESYLDANPQNLYCRNAYDAVLTLKEMGITEEETRKGQEICQYLIQKIDPSVLNNSSVDFLYSVPLANEVGLKLSEQTLTAVNQLLQRLKDAFISGGQVLSLEYLPLIWQTQGNKGGVFSEADILQMLEKRSDNGAYFIPNFPVDSPTGESGVQYVDQKDLYQTYCGIYTLKLIGSNDVVKKDLTKSFVMSCKQQFGFRQAPDGYWTNLRATYSGLMILELLSD